MVHAREMFIEKLLGLLATFQFLQNFKQQSLSGQWSARPLQGSVQDLAIRSNVWEQWKFKL